MRPNNHTVAKLPRAASCENLQAEYFPTEPSRCFLYNPTSSIWEETVSGSLPSRRQFIPDHSLCTDPARCGRSGDELLELKRTRLDWHKFLAPTASGSASFTVGDGRICTEPVYHPGYTVTNTQLDTSQTFDVSALCASGYDGSPSVTACATTADYTLSGCTLAPVCTAISAAEYLTAGNVAVTTVAGTTVAGVGAVTCASGYEGTAAVACASGTTGSPGTFTASGCSAIVCTDVIVRVATTQPRTDGLALQWELNDGGANGPWQLQFPGTISATGAQEDCVGLGCSWFQGRFEVEACLFDNYYTVTGQGGAGWQGTVSVVSVVDDNTIYIPVDENWIVHGINSGDVPIMLDARLSTGYRHRPDDGDFPISTSAPDDASYLSHANLVLRNVRISGQIATLDKMTATRTMSNRRIGSEPAARLGGALFYEGFGSKLILDRSVFDHNLATSGGVMMVDGRMEQQHIANTNSPQTTEVHVSNCFFLKNWAAWVGGIIRPNDVWPVVINYSDTVFVENLALIGNNIGLSLYDTMPDCVDVDPTGPGCLLDGAGRVELHRVHSQSYQTKNYLSDCSMALFSGLQAAPGATYNTILEDVVFAGQTGYTNTAVNWWDPNSNTAVSMGPDTMLVRDFVLKDNVAYGGLYGAFTFVGDIFDGARLRFFSNHAAGAGAAGGALRLDATTTSKLSHCEFTGNSAGVGGALWVGGSASHEIHQSLFDGNIAATQSGAVNSVTTNDVPLLVQSSIFNNNEVRLSEGVASFADLTFRIFTASVGMGMSSTKNENALAAVHPVWFIGAVDNGLSATGQVHKPSARDGSVDSMRQALSGNTCVRGACPDGTKCACPDGATCTADADYTCGQFTIYGHQDYGDDYYDVSTTIAQVLRLSAGEHRMWHGSVISTSQILHVNWDNGGWMDIVDIKDKVYPEFCDNRGAQCTNTLDDFYDDPTLLDANAGRREPGGCYAATDAGCDAVCSVSADFTFDAAGVPRDDYGRSRDQCLVDELTTGSHCCWIGQMYWSYTDFEVPYGVGGAILTASAGSTSIRDSTFQNNYAGTGAAISAVNLELDVTNSSFDMSGNLASQYTAEADHIDAAEANLQTCETMACNAGMQCRLAGFAVRMCEPCPINAVGDGRTCHQCLAGTEPNSDQTACIPCEPGSRSEIGICQSCAGEKLIAPVSGQVLCDQCPLSTRADSDHLMCLCDSGTYNGTAAVHVCFYRGYDAEHYQSELGRHDSMPAGFDCDTCPGDQLGDSCLTCDDGRTVIAPGHTVPDIRELESSITNHISVFRCHPDMEIAVKRCPGSDAVAGARRFLSAPGDMCAAGYEGYMCGACEEGFGMNGDKECETCEESGFTWGTLGAMAAMIGGVLVLFGAISMIWGNFPLKHAFRCAAQPTRILITYSQVTSQLGDVSSQAICRCL